MQEEKNSRELQKAKLEFSIVFTLYLHYLHSIYILLGFLSNLETI